MDSRAAFQFLEMLSWISKSWHALFTLLFPLGVILKTCFISKRRRRKKKKGFYECADSGLLPQIVSMDSHASLEEERLFIFPIYLGMACLDVLSTCIFTVRDLQLWGWRGCRACCALFAASGVACRRVGVAEMECLWSQVHPESKRCHHISVSS